MAHRRTPPNPRPPESTSCCPGTASPPANYPTPPETARAGSQYLRETSARQAIRDALTAPDCAVAHSVISIAKVRDIDQLVATPVRLWVIETRYRPVPREQFPEVLRRIAHNTTAAWEWAPAGTPVRGCLVLANDDRTRRKTFDYGKEPVVIHTPASLTQELAAETRKERVIDERVAASVRKLGRTPE